jgi:4-hydroxy-tetrahydrodipicolinate synthase
MFLGGVWATTVTPFDEGGNIDEVSLRNLVDHYIDSGVQGLSLGILGEVSKLSDFERDRVVDIMATQTNGRVPICVVCTAQGTKKASGLAKKAEQLGAQAVMIAPPNKLNDEAELFRHFSEIANDISIPIVLQDNPGTTGSKMSATLLARMANDIENVQYVKLEEGPTTVKISNILEKTDKLQILSGGAIFLYEELERGAMGTMSGFPFPEVLVELFNLLSENKKREARDHFNKYLPLMRYDEILPPTVEDRAIIKKEVFRLKGIIKSSNVRKPASKMDQKVMEELKELIEYVGLVDVVK